MKSVKVAYVFLIILLAALGYTTYIKFNYEDEKKDNTYYDVNSVPLSTVANNYNNANYGDGVNTSATINANNLIIKYDNKEYIFGFTNGVLKYNIAINSNINLKTINEMFIYLVDAVSVSMGNQEKDSFVTTNLIINNIYVNETVKVIKTNNEVTYVIDTTKNMVLYKASNIYKDKMIMNINDRNFDIDINNIRLISPVLKFDEEKNIFNVMCYVENEDNTSSKIVITLYDKEKKEVTKQEIDTSNVDSILSMDFDLNEFTEDDIIYYSLHIE